VIPAATAAADPPDEPPGTQRTSWGLRVGPNALFSVHIGLGDDHRTVGAQSRNRCRLERAHVTAENSGSACGWKPKRCDVVLDGNGHAGKDADVGGRVEMLLHIFRFSYARVLI
jgi:hypothetical protein